MSEKLLNQKKNKHFLLYIDGGARGNPGSAACAWILKDDARIVITSGGKYLQRTTNNMAEYQGLVNGVKEALNNGVKTLTIYSDSELLVKQIKGEYKTKNIDLRLLQQEFVRLIKDISVIDIKHIARELNKEADLIVNIILDQHETKK